MSFDALDWFGRSMLRLAHDYRERALLAKRKGDNARAAQLARLAILASRAVHNTARRMRERKELQ